LTSKVPKQGGDGVAIEENGEGYQECLGKSEGFRPKKVAMGNGCSRLLQKDRHFDNEGARGGKHLPSCAGRTSRGGKITLEETRSSHKRRFATGNQRDIWGTALNPLGGKGGLQMRKTTGTMRGGKSSSFFHNNERNCRVVQNEVF